MLRFNKRRLIPVMSIFTLTLSACANSPQLPKYDSLLAEQTQQNGRECIRSNEIRGYGVLDNEIISVESSRKNAYFLMTTLPGCHSINSSFKLAFVSRFGEICGNTASKVVSDDNSSLK